MIRMPPVSGSNRKQDESQGVGGLPLPPGERRNTVVWTVAGFDPSSGAGVTADLMTFAAQGLFGCSAITAYTVQNTVGVTGVEPVRAELLAGTLSTLFEDMPPRGVKVGMLGTVENAGVLTEFLHGLRGLSVPMVLDPVLVSSSGRALFPVEGGKELREGLLREVDWVTPNWAELAVLSERPVGSLREAEGAARRLMEGLPGLRVVVTGGDQERTEDLLVMPDGAVHLFQGERVETRSTHGTGCAFSSALLARLVLGDTAVEAVGAAKAYVRGALLHAPGVGSGRGPMELLWPLRRG